MTIKIKFLLKTNYNCPTSKVSGGHHVYIFWFADSRHRSVYPERPTVDDRRRARRDTAPDYLERSD